MKSITVSYDININKKGAGRGDFKAVYITDLHDRVWNEDQLFLPKLIKDQKPDIIFCGGDMIVAHPKEKNYNALEFMKRMLDIAPVYFGLGNHEFRSMLYKDTYGDMYKRFMQPLLDGGMNLLVNEKADVDINGANLTVYGLEIPKKNYKRLENVPFTLDEMKELLGKRKKDRAGILLAHNPKFHKTYERWGADLILCGHNHGGIMRIGSHTGLVSPSFEMFAKFSQGHIETNGKHLVISSGLGEHTVPLRIHNPRELVVLNISVNTH